MKLKILKPVTIAEQPVLAGDPIEVEDQTVCDALIADGSAVEFTAEQEQAEVEQAQTDLVRAEAERIKIEQKSFKAVTKTATQETKSMKDLMFKSFKKSLETKAVSAVEGVSATEYMGYVTDGVASKIWADIAKWNLKDSTMRIVYRNGVKAFAVTAEGTANALSAVPLAKTATSDKYLGSFTTASEYVEDVDGMSAYLNGGLVEDLLSKVIAGMIDGSANGASFAGLEGIAASADCLSATFVSMTAPTIPELLVWKNKIDPNLRSNMKFILPVAFGAGVEAAALTAGNIGGQYINLEKGTLFGRPYFVMDGITTPIVGDFRQYPVNVARDIKVATTENAATDTIETGVSIRVAGGIGWKAGTATAAFAKAIVAG